MRWGTLLMAAGFLTPTGCQLARNVVHNLANESAEQWDERKLSRQLRAEARAAWATYCQQSGGAFSADFADGFQDGYADHLESGGNGRPPAVPPLRYRRRDSLTPEGHARIHDYFAGFKAGLDAAAASGRRQFLTVPVLVSDAPTPARLPGTQIPRSAEPLRAGEPLPAPRRLDPTTGLPIPDRPLVEPIPLPAIPGKEYAPDPLKTKIPEPPKSDAGARPTVTPVAAETRAPPEWPVVWRKSAPPEEPPLGRRRLDRE